LTEHFDGVGRNDKGDEVDVNGRVSIDITGKDYETIKIASDADTAKAISRKNNDGTDWKIVYDDPTYPSTYFLAARSHGYFGMGTQAVIVPLHQFEAWLRGIIEMPPKPRPDHLFDTKAGAFEWLNTITPQIKADFERDRGGLILGSNHRVTGEAGMQSISTLQAMVNPFRK
jgi:hypothetical protein